MSSTVASTLAHDLAGQFVLGQSETLVPRGWRAHQIGQWLLAFRPKLPVVQIQSREGAQIGWLLGYAIHPDRGLLSAIPHVSFDCGVADGPDEFERSLYQLGGRFAAVYLASPGARFYLDPCGSLSVIFCREERIAASSPNLVPYSERTPENHGLVRSIGIPEKGGWYPFGLTPPRGRGAAVAQSLPGSRNVGDSQALASPRRVDLARGY